MFNEKIKKIDFGNAYDIYKCITCDIIIMDMKKNNSNNLLLLRSDPTDLN